MGRIKLKNKEDAQCKTIAINKVNKITWGFITTL